MVALPPVKRFQSAGGARVYQIPCQVFPDLSARVYLVLGAGPPTLVDAGSGQGNSTADILRGIAAVRSDHHEAVRPADIRRILITHSHFDHFGGLGQLLAAAPAEVIVHSLGRRAIEAFDEYATLSIRQLSNFLIEAGVPEKRRAALVRSFGLWPGRVPSVPVNRTIEDGDVLDGMRVYHMPGHAAGLVCLAIDDILLCNDLLLARTIPQQWPESLGPFLGIHHYLESLRRLEQLHGYRLGLAGHEAPIHDLRHRIGVVRESLARRQQRVLDLLATSDHALTSCEMAGKLHGHGNDFRAVLAVTDVGARVEHLYQQGRLAVANLAELASDERAPYRYIVTEAAGQAPPSSNLPGGKELASGQKD